MAPLGEALVQPLGADSERFAQQDPEVPRTLACRGL
jgi:hypothetical protein